MVKKVPWFLEKYRNIPAHFHTSFSTFIRCVCSFPMDLVKTSLRKHTIELDLCLGFMETWKVFHVPSGLRIVLSFTSVFILMVLFQIPLDYTRGNSPAKCSANKTSWVNKQESRGISFVTFPNFLEIRSFILKMQNYSSDALQPLPGHRVDHPSEEKGGYFPLQNPTQQCLHSQPSHPPSVVEHTWQTNNTWALYNLSHPLEITRGGLTLLLPPQTSQFNPAQLNYCLESALTAAN